MSEKLEKLINIVDQQGQETGEKKDYVAVHRDGNWHKSFHLWIIKEQKYVLLSRRPEHKDLEHKDLEHKDLEHKNLEPHKLSVSMSCHFYAGETILHIIDKIKNSLGLKLELKDLQYLETVPVETFYPNSTNRELQEIYITFCDKPLNDYYLDHQEIYALYEIPIDKALKLFQQGSYVAVAGFDAYQRENNAMLVKENLTEETRENIAQILQKIKTFLAVSEEVG